MRANRQLIATSGAPFSGRVLQLEVTGASARFEIPAWLAGADSRWVALDADIDVLCGVEDVTVTFGQVSSVVGEVITAHAESGGRLVAGREQRFTMPPVSEATHFAAATAGDAATLVISAA